MRQHTRTTHRLVAGLAALSIAIAPAVLGPGVAHAGKKGGASAGAAKCAPGMVVTVTINGNKKTYVCNKKGKFVEVLELVAGGGGGQVTAVPATQALGS
ncbi:MAG: hypothetical protein QOG77_329 [Solirubrobacteraceae bacterium]|jgi:hypothetical protein|nr:hypothetical protein [Solirubrobacteraceae bacterium]